MPGAYINGDVRAWQSIDKSLFSFLSWVFTSQVLIYNSASGYGPTSFTLVPNGGIYTWNSQSAKRGPGGSPIYPCQGS
jgi:hypothetical protein